MEEELKNKIANSAGRICEEYKKISALLTSISPQNAVLQQYLMHLDSTVHYVVLHFQDAESIELATCKRHHDPARLLNDVESKFKMQEEGFFLLYPDTQFRARIKDCFDATRLDFEIIEECLSKIPG